MRKFWMLTAAAVGLSASAQAQEPIQLLHPESEYVLTFRMQEMVKSQLVQKHALESMKAAMSSNAEFKKVTDALGLDPLKDLNTATFGISGDDPNNMDFSAVVDGKFDAKKIVELAKKEKDAKLKMSEVDGKTLFEMEQNGKTTYGAVANDKYIVMGSKKEFVTNSFSVISGSSKGGLKNNDLNTLVKKSDSKKAMSLYAVTKGKLKNLPIPNADENMTKLLGTLETVTVELGVTSDVDLTISLGADKAESAKAMATTFSPLIDQAKGLAPLFLGQQPELKPLEEVVKSLKIEDKGNQAIISAKMPESVVLKLMDLAKKQ